MDEIPFHYIQSSITHLCPLRKMTNSATKSQNGHFPQGDFLNFSPVIHAGEVLEFSGPKLPLLSQAVVQSCTELIFTPHFFLVPLQTGVKFEHLIYPLWVESNINKKCRLRWGTFCPLDAHTDDYFALMFLTDQWTTIVFLQEKDRVIHQIPHQQWLYYTTVYVLVCRTWFLMVRWWLLDKLFSNHCIYNTKT